MSNLTDVPDKEAGVPERVWIKDNREFDDVSIVPELGHIEYVRTSHAIALISAKRDEWRKCNGTNPARWERDLVKAEGADILLALLTGENKDSECEAKGNSTTT